MPLDAVKPTDDNVQVADVAGFQPAADSDPAETQDWLDALDAILETSGPDRARYLLTQLQLAAMRHGVATPTGLNTPYVNTIPADEQPDFPGDRDLERKIKSLTRWNAMAMVARGHNGGHISTYASAATLYEIGFNHFFQGPDAQGGGDSVFIQGHASPGIYARAYLEGRLSDLQLKNYRQELAAGGGLASYPHPWLMPNFWQFATVSMGLGPIMAIYQARFNRYLGHRGIKDTSQQHVWCFIGDGETDEPEALGAITLAARERLDNLIFVVNCNLQRLDGPVRGNGKIIQELETAFRGAGWNVIKVVWGSDWDPLIERDDSGRLVQRMGEVLDGDYQKYSVESGAYIREHFFGKYPELLELVRDMTDDQLQQLRRGGHDPVKVYAAYRSAVEHVGTPTVILAKTVKGYGLGEAGEGKNTTHQQKKMTADALKHFRERFNLPIPPDQLAEMANYKPSDESPEIRYLKQRRQELGGSLPARVVRAKSITAPKLDAFKAFLAGSGTSEASTTMAFVGMLRDVLLKDKVIGKFVVPIIPDEARTFGMDPLFKPYGIYSSVGQLYDPVDSKVIASYREAKNGQILEEGITECGAMSSFIAAASSYATHGVATIPFFIYYSMFGFQRIGDSIYAAADMRCRGFLLGATAGRTTLNGEGLQHQDGHSHILASTVPTLVAYDPAFAYEVAVIIQDGIRRMYEVGEDILFYLTLCNENYVMPPMPEGAPEGILKGLYKFKPATIQAAVEKRVHLFGSGVILRECLRAQLMLAEKFGVAADVWSATSYKELRRDALACDRWNRLHPAHPPKKSYVQTILENEKGPFIAASDYMKLLPELIGPWTPGGLTTLGTDGFGRSDDRSALRRHFEVDAECIAIAALAKLAKIGSLQPADVDRAIKLLGVDPEKVDPVRA
jgi:pyruvate dehydrogenase E1 component